MKVKSKTSLWVFFCLAFVTIVASVLVLGFTQADFWSKFTSLFGEFNTFFNDIKVVFQRTASSPVVVNGWIGVGGAGVVIFVIVMWVIALIRHKVSRVQSSIALLVTALLVCVTTFALLNYDRNTNNAFASALLKLIQNNASAWSTVVVLVVTLLFVLGGIFTFLACVSAVSGSAKQEKVAEVAAQPQEEKVEEVKEEPTTVEEPKEEEKVEEVKEEPAPQPAPVAEEEPKQEEKVEEAKEEAAPVEEPKQEEKVEEVKEEPAPVEEPKQEEKVEEPAPQPEPEPAVAVAAAAVVAADEEEEESNEENQSKDRAPRVKFEDKIEKADPEVKSAYEELKAYALAYGVKSRISSAGDTFHLHTKRYIKMVVAGSRLKLYFALNPKDYENASFKVGDASSMKNSEDIPLVYKVTSNLAVKRAKSLIDDVMKKDGLVQKEIKPLPKVEKKPAAPKKKPAPKKVVAPVVEPSDPEQKYSGKYEVYPEAGLFKFRLKASNGEILLVSNGYKSREGAIGGINTLKNAMPAGKATIVTDKKGFSQFRISTANDARVIITGEFYNSLSSCQSALASAEKFCTTGKIVQLDEIPDDEVREYIVELPKTTKLDNGKLELYIDEADNKWRGRLSASNGEVLFVTTSYSSKQGLNNGIKAIKDKINGNNVRVERDKQNRWQFKLLTDNGQLVVVGETYASKESAISAATSVKNFIDNAKVIDLTKAPKEE